MRVVCLCFRCAKRVSPLLAHETRAPRRMYARMYVRCVALPVREFARRQYDEAKRRTESKKRWEKYRNRCTFILKREWELPARTCCNELVFFFFSFSF